VAERAPVVIYGAGGFAREVCELVRDIDADSGRWELLGFLDDRPESRGTVLNDLPVLGGAAWIVEQQRPVYVALGVGSPAAKRRLAERLRGRAAGFPALVHPTVVASRYVDYGDGVIVTAGNVLTTNIVLGDFAMLNLTCTVGHDTTVGAFATISPGVNVSGRVHIGDGCEIGTGAAIIQGVTIGAWSVVGAGAVVTKDLPADCTAVGVPAKPIKHRVPGWQNV
jgi:sugar O-acyltransferase (sialic acid O-acetyltransferase NeuD family)